MPEAAANFSLLAFDIAFLPVPVYTSARMRSFPATIALVLLLLVESRVALTINQARM